MSVVSGFGERLKQAVNRSGGATAVSRMSGVALSTLNDYLKGKEARFSRVTALAKACEVSLDWLATGRDNPSATVDTTGGKLESSFGEALSQPANFFIFCLVMASCQEYYSKLNKVPSLAESFEWISTPYSIGRELSDQPIKLASPTASDLREKDS